MPEPALRLCVSLLLAMAMPGAALAAEPSGGVNAIEPGVDLRRHEALVTGWHNKVRPFVAEHCLSCHGADKPKADLDLARFADLPSVVAQHRQWQTVLEVLEGGEMPPRKAKQPSPEARAEIVAWLKDLRSYEADRHAGDPGLVLARRLSNAEYDYTVRDLTGVDIRPTREFPVDPANEAGFDNSGESLAMSPALMRKYLAAARTVSEHVVLTPDGLRFSPHPVVTDIDRDKYAVLRIIEFYKRQPTDLAAYFEAAWRYHHRARLGRPDEALAGVAAAMKVSPRYLATVAQALFTPEPEGPMAKVQARFAALPAPTGEKPSAAELAAVRQGAEQMRDFIVRVRERTVPTWKNIQLKAVATGAQPFILWKNTQYATHRRAFDPGKLWVANDAEGTDEIARRAEGIATLVATNMRALGPLGASSVAAAPLDFYRHFIATYAKPDPDLAIPPGAEARRRYEAAFTRFAQIFPDAFLVSERGRAHLDRPKELQDKGRFLTAGFHNMFGFFRDDRPLCELILDEAGRKELDRLWRELDFITDAPTRQHADFIFYERAEPPRTIKGPEFDFVRSEDKNATSSAMVRRMSQIYIAKAKQHLREFGGDKHGIPVLEQYFAGVDRNLRRVERDRRQAETAHVRDVIAFAERAYRRPLQARERTQLAAFYRKGRHEDGLSHEDAIRDTIASVLVSPNYLYRVDLVADTTTGARTRPARPGGARPLPDHALASRLSYFLWSSLPDAALLAKARAGQLRNPEVLAAEARRLLADDRARALAIEFGGQWLEHRRFEEHNGVDRKRFPSFDGDLRRAMYEEPIHFFADVVKQDRSVLSFIDGRHTFVNASLAKHYGMPLPDASLGADAWVRVDDADRYGRGGILPMAAFLTKNAPGLRTSPVKRGYWVVRRVLGVPIPPPPAQVPDLPNDESKMGQLTVRQALAKHREDPSCAGCHAKFDSFGLAFEGYGPVGERRQRDLGGRPVDARAEFPLGKGAVDGVGVDGLRSYLGKHRRDDFLDNFTRKLLAYALGRSLMLSDDSTVAELRASLAEREQRFSALVEAIVKTPQFLNKRPGALALQAN